MFDPPLN